jgi:hypothetical protein
VGEIGFPRREFLFDIRWWEARRIIKGSEARTRQLWSATRWQTYFIMSAQIGSKGMRESNINSPRDLIEFPWEKEPAPELTEEEAAELLEEMKAFNGH